MENRLNFCQTLPHYANLADEFLTCGPTIYSKDSKKKLLTKVFFLRIRAAKILPVLMLLAQQSILSGHKNILNRTIKFF
jgi:hypothetical protein